MSDKATTNLKCQVPGCNHEEKDYLADHLLEAHSLTVKAYLSQFPGAETMSRRLLDRFSQKKNPRRESPPSPDSLRVLFGNISFAVNPEVPEEACLPLPAHYRVPRFGALGDDVLHACISLRHRRSLYVHGLPGTGKDALFHAWSVLTRTPAIIKQVIPGTDIEGWFFSRGFDANGTFWEEGAVVKALRDGHTTKSGKCIPYLFLVTDFDRADKDQAEHLRLICDSIQGRIDGPAGKVYKVLPGSIVVASANTAGGGDERGRMISANPLDASLFDRFERKIQFHWMDWRDEEEIVKAKFPLLVQHCPKVFRSMGNLTKAVREAILNGDLYGEFSHRALCAILGHASDTLECYAGRKMPKNLLKIASRAWIDGLPDEETREAAKKICDPHINTLEEGDTSHINTSTSLADDWSK